MKLKSRGWLWLLLLIPIGFGFARLKFDVEVLNLLPNELSVVRGLKLYQTRFSSGRELVITVEAKEAADAETAARSLAQVLRAETNLVSSVTWQPFWLEHPTQAAELIAFLWLNQSPENFAQLTNRLSGSNAVATLAETREKLATSMSPMEIARRGYDPYDLMTLPENVSGGAPAMGEGQDLFASPDGSFRIVFVEAKYDLKTYRQSDDWVKKIKAVAQNAQAKGEIPASVSIGFTGSPAFVAEIATGMESDMTSSVLGTLVIIAILFWWAHRRWKPMFWIITLLLLVLAGTTALGGLIFGTMNVVSLGFAAILLGLGVDYGLVLYQESQSDPDATAAELRRAVGSGILWSAVTTAGAFAILNLGGLPGLAQLGSLVAIGVTLSAVVMLYFYLPPLLGSREGNKSTSPIIPENKSPKISEQNNQRLAWGATIGIIIIAAISLARNLPGFDHDSGALRPRNSSSYAALEKIKSRMQQGREPLWTLISGQNETEVAQRLDKVQRALDDAVSKNLIASFTLPTTLWPRPDYQSNNRSALGEIISQKENLKRAALAEGFTTNSFAMTDSMMKTWENATASTNVFWPTNDASRWVFGKLVARKQNEFIVLGLIQPSTNQTASKTFSENFQNKFKDDGVLVSGWELLGAALFNYIRADLPKVFVPMLLLLLVSLWLAFKRISEVLLSLATLAFSGLCLWTVMSLAGWSWNLLNIMALPLLLGAGVDYSIHVQLAMRRLNGDRLAVHKNTGRALFLCGGTTVAGFGSLSWSSNTGMASLGQVCAVGIFCSMITAIYLLPAWWTKIYASKSNVQS